MFRSQLLPISQTFVRDQASFLKEWEPLLIGHRIVPDGLSLNELRYRVVPRGSRVAFNLRRLLAVPQPRVELAIKQSGAALVHVHFGTDATDCWPAIRAAGLPMVVTLHGYDINTRRDWWEAGHGGFVRRSYPRRLLRMARDPTVHFIAVSNAIQQRAAELGIAEDKISVCHVGVDTDRFAPTGQPLEERSRRILFVGRMVEKKAPLILIRAFADLRHRVPDAELVMIGDGPLLPAAKRLAQELQSPVEFLGAGSSSVVLENLQLARVFCLPSITASNGDAEGLPVSLLEAQACGVPVVTSARGGALEGLLPGMTGQEFPEADIQQLADRLCTWLVDEGLARQAFRAARQFAQDTFDIRRCTRKLELIYDRVATSGP